ncbi:MAG TPA: sigma-70 family RNA polymerase sigma factor [Opitutales bacterium]|nr:sigma-70 family RNA polymerase sigma factor [Opitutales bacterium]
MSRPPNDAPAPLSEPTPAAVVAVIAETRATPPVFAQSPEERAARQAIARHRSRLDWAMHLPEFEPFFKEGLKQLGLPPPRRGIGLRALVDSMMLEAKKDLLLWVMSSYRGMLSGHRALRMAENWGVALADLPWLDADTPLSAARWPQFREQLQIAINREHRRYKEAQELLFILHHDLPERLAQRLVFDPAKRADAVQEGCLGLLHAIDKVDAGETPFGSYAHQWVTRAIRNYLLGERFPVHVPVNLASQILREASHAKPGETPSTRPERSLLQPRVPLDNPHSTDEKPLALPDESTPNPRELLNRQDLLGIVQDMINQLSDKQREVLVRRYGLGSGHEAETLMNIAQSIGISHQQVSMREKRALEKLGSILRPMFREMYG